MRHFSLRMPSTDLLTLSKEFNSELTLKQPLLMQKITSTGTTIVVPQMIRITIQGIAEKLLNNANKAIQNGNRNGSITLNEVEIYAIIICQKFGGFDHFSEYTQHVILAPIINRSYQITLAQDV